MGAGGDFYIPSDVFSTGKDALPPLENLLRGLRMLPDEGSDDDNDFGWAFTGTPQSVAILEAGATSLTKAWTVLITALGGAGAVGGAVLGFYTAQLPAVQTVLISGSAIIVVATILAVAWMVCTDITSRTRGALTIYDIRKDLALEFVRRASGASSPEAPDQAHDALVVALAAARSQADVIHDNSDGHLHGICEQDGQIKVLFVDRSDGQETWYPPAEIRVSRYTYPDP